MDENKKLNILKDRKLDRQEKKAQFENLGELVKIPIFVG